MCHWEVSRNGQGLSLGHCSPPPLQSEEKVSWPLPPTWCKLVHCLQGSHRDGASWTHVPLDCREQSPSCHHTSTLGKRALEETQESCSWSQIISISKKSNLSSVPEIFASLLWMHLLQSKTRKSDATVREEKSLCALLKQRQLQSWPSPIPFHCFVPWAFHWVTFPSDQILAAVFRLSEQHSVTDQDHPHTHLALNFCNSPTLQMDGRKINEEFTIQSKWHEEEKEFRRQRRKKRTRRHRKQVLSPMKISCVIGWDFRSRLCQNRSFRLHRLITSKDLLTWGLPAWIMELWCLEIKKETVHPDLMAVSKHAHTLTSSHPSSFSIAFLYSSWERLFKQHSGFLVWLFFWW